MRNIFFLTVFLFLTVVRANDKKICIYLGAKKLEDFQQENYRLASFYCKDGQEARFDEDSRDNKKMLSRDLPLSKALHNHFSIKYFKNNKVIKTKKFKFYYRSISIGSSIEVKNQKKEIERVYWYERRFVINDLALADEIQVFKEKKLVISDKINFDYYKGE